MTMTDFEKIEKYFGSLENYLTFQKEDLERAKNLKDITKEDGFYDIKIDKIKDEIVKVEEEIEKRKNSKETYKISFDEDGLKIVIEALEEAEAYYTQNLFDSYDHFDELEKIIENLKELQNRG